MPNPICTVPCVSQDYEIGDRLRRLFSNSYRNLRSMLGWYTDRQYRLAQHRAPSKTL